MSGSNYDIAYLKKYVNGELSPTEMYAIEREAQRDPMLADILMGMELDQGSSVLPDLEHRITQRTTGQQATTARLFDWKKLAIAAAVLAVLATGIIYFQQQPSPSDTQRTANITAPSDKIDSRTLPQDSAVVSPGIDSVLLEDQHPRLAESRKLPAPHSYAPDETSSVLDKPALRVKSMKEIEMEISPDRPAFGLGSTDSSAVMAYTAEAERSIAATNRPALKSYNNALAGKVAGLNTAQQAGSPVQITVHNKETGLPISGVTIIQPNSKLATNTDDKGKATIQPSTMDSLVDIMALGYNTVALNMRRNKNLNIKLEPNSGVLDEVVVTTMSTRKTKSAEPIWGWKSFNSYVKKRTAKSQSEGTVRLSFYIDKDGFPTNINVLQSANDYLDAKAKEILLSGPKWKGEDYRYVTFTFEFTP